MAWLRQRDGVTCGPSVAVMAGALLDAEYGAPMRAALTAFAISATVHGVTMFFLEPEHVLTALGFWGVPHLLLLPALLYSAWRESKGVQR